MSKRTILLIVLATQVLLAVNIAGWWWFRSSSGREKATPVVAPSPAAGEPRAAVQPPGGAVPGQPVVAPRGDPPVPAQPEQVFDAPPKAVDPARGGPPVPTNAGLKKLTLIPPEQAGVIPDNPAATAPMDAASLAKMQETKRSRQHCSSADEAKVSHREFVIRERSTPKLGQPTAVASRIWYGGFPVVIHTVKGNGRKVFVDDEARQAAVAGGVCTWALPLVAVPADVGSFDQPPDLEVYLPVAVPETPAPPLRAGSVDAGFAYVGKPTLSAKAGPGDIATFLAAVRASGAVPRGPLLSRLDDQGTYSRDDDTVQFIQPIITP